MKNRITAFCCENSAHKVVESMQGDPLLKGVTIIKVPCVGRVETIQLLQEFEKGVEQVLVLGCPIDNCKHLKGNLRAVKRVAMTRKSLQDAGIDGDRLRVEMISSVDVHKLRDILKEITNE